MISDAQIKQTTQEPSCTDLIETMDTRSDGQHLSHEIRCLRAIISELLIKNQHLRWELQKYPQRVPGS
jgi:hypothetical protein